MAVSSQNPDDGPVKPENSNVRDPDAEGLASIKARIAEYKDAGMDTAYLEEQATVLTNKRKGHRRSDAVDRDDSTDGAAEMVKAEKARKADKPADSDVEPSSVEDGVINPDNAPGAKSSIPDQVSEPAERIDGPGKKGTSVPDQGPKRGDENVSSAASKKSAESFKKSPSAADTKVEDGSNKPAPAAPKGAGPVATSADKEQPKK